MSFKTKQGAQQEAAALQAEVGPEWVTHVHQNLGWHASVLSPCGRFYVHRYKGQSPGKYQYSCLLGRPWSYTGKWTGHGDTAQEAIENARQKALAFMTPFADLLDQHQSALSVAGQLRHGMFGSSGKLEIC